MRVSSTEWNARHRAAATQPQAEPATIVVELLPLLPHGLALDLACGLGRHTLLLAQRRQPVVAVDYSPVALHVLAERARAAQLKVQRTAGREIPAGTPGHGIHLVQADLEQAVLPPDSFSLILCIQYLQRGLFPQMERALHPGGFLLFETYTRAQLEFSGGPRNPEHLLEEGELRKAFPGLRVVFYRELRAEKGIASLLAQKHPGKH